MNCINANSFIKYSKVPENQPVTISKPRKPIKAKCVLTNITVSLLAPMPPRNQFRNTTILVRLIVNKQHQWKNDFFFQISLQTKCEPILVCCPTQVHVPGSVAFVDTSRKCTYTKHTQSAVATAIHLIR